ncbi:hypothetical protein DUNSADRAFT_7841 [Dunaliella salina]|uniref:Protein kinase domain-containing protein n=1 Tax=Dunaliella salina TaxID=3046 RepID=A0ABQ7FT58_DUNSA|nr:hypothetical protein DUNSADRAFT_7841 [Dunaliella salina]|eukprot:KAF5825648.1 hypothetical protein DUNSADRAFT_7841 [Dunaliella salina]
MANVDYIDLKILSKFVIIVKLGQGSYGVWKAIDRKTQGSCCPEKDI